MSECGIILWGWDGRVGGIIVESHTNSELFGEKRDCYCDFQGIGGYRCGQWKEGCVYRKD